jgi:hypothetical protein
LGGARVPERRRLIARKAADVSKPMVNANDPRLEM